MTLMMYGDNEVLVYTQNSASILLVLWLLLYGSETWTLNWRTGVKVGRNAPERSSGAHQFGHKRSGVQTNDYCCRNARSTTICCFEHCEL